MSNQSMNTPQWGNEITLEQVNNGKVYSVFTRGTISKPAEYAEAVRKFRDCLLYELLGPRPGTKSIAQERAENFKHFAENIAHFAAVDPKIVGDIGGVTLKNAQFVVSSVAATLGNLSGPARSLINTPIGSETMKVVAATWLNVCSAAKDVSTSSGTITKSAIDTASGYKAYYYPAAILEPLREIQNAYDGLAIKLDAGVKSLLQTQGFKIEQMNTAAGHFQGVVPIAEQAVRDLAPQLFRRDLTRPVFDASRALVQVPSRVIVLSINAMRTIITSALEMSIELGQARRNIIVPEKDESVASQPRKTTYEILASSPFAKIIELAKDTKRYFNPSGTKDLAHFNSLSPVPAGQPPTYSIYSDLYWKSISFQQLADGRKLIKCENSSIVVEVESRCRISEYNNTEACGPAPAKRPSAKEIKLPSYTSFMKNPREISDLLLSSSAASGWDNFVEATKMRKDLLVRMTALYTDVCNKNFEQFKSILKSIVDDITGTCGLITLTHLVRTIGESIASASSSAGCITAPSKKANVGPKV